MAAERQADIPSEQSQRGRWCDESSDEEFQKGSPHARTELLSEDSGTTFMNSSLKDKVSDAAPGEVSHHPRVHCRVPVEVFSRHERGTGRQTFINCGSKDKPKWVEVTGVYAAAAWSEDLRFTCVAVPDQLQKYLKRHKCETNKQCKQNRFFAKYVTEDVPEPGMIVVGVNEKQLFKGSRKIWRYIEVLCNDLSSSDGTNSTTQSSEAAPIIALPDGHSTASSDGTSSLDPPLV